MKAASHHQHSYVVSIGNRGGLINETKRVFNLYSQGLAVPEIQKKVVDENILGKRSSAWSECIFQIIKQRYFDTLSKAELQSLSQVLNSMLSDLSKNFILFFHLCLFDRLVFDFVTDYVFRKYYDGAMGISKLDVEAFLHAREKKHPEILTWTASTRAKLGRGLLAALAGFNILKGSKKKEFARVQLPLEVFLYICYFLKDKGLSVKAIISSAYFTLFLLDQRDVLALLNEAMKKGHLQFSARGEIYNLKFHLTNLREYVGGLAKQVLPAGRSFI